MKRLWKIGLFVGLVWAGYFSAVFADRTVYAADVVIICHKGVTDSALSQKDIRDIYLGKKIDWTNGKKIVFVMLKEGPIMDAFLEKYVEKSAAQFESYWRKLLFSGKGILPPSMDDEAKMIDFVSKTEGAIGYVSAVAARQGVNEIIVK
jgi:ABC-type phosphate transport system substrate-binding protein